MTNSTAPGAAGTARPIPVFRADRVYGQNDDFTTRFEYRDPMDRTHVRPATAGDLVAPEGVCVDRQGGVYIADTQNHRVLYYPAGSTRPTHVLGQGPDGHDFDSGVANRGGISASTFYLPTGLALDSAGRLLVCDSGNNRVLVFEPGQTAAMRVYGQLGSFITGEPGTGQHRLYVPMGLALDERDNLYVADSGSHRVLFIDRNSTQASLVYGQRNFTENLPNRADYWHVAPPTRYSLSLPSAVALDSHGNLYVADRENNRVVCT